MQTPPSLPPALPGSQPVTTEARVASLDILRGIALFGILLINIVSFALALAAAENPFYHGEIASLDYTAWWFNHYFVGWRAISTFGFLFGAGIILSTQKKDEFGLPVALHFYRRYGILAAVGVGHAYFVWFGDILFPYATAAAIVFLMRKSSPRILLSTGLFALISSIAVYSIFFCIDSPEFTQYKWPAPDELAEEIATVRGPWLGWFIRNAFHAAAIQFGAVPMGLGGFCAGLMLMGMGLQKSGFFAGYWSLRYYVSGALIGITLGFAMTWSPAQVNLLNLIELPYLHVLKGNLSGPVMAFGYLCIVLLLLRSPSFKGILSVFAPAGQMTLTLYLMQSVVCGFVFNGYGMKLFETMGRASLWIFCLVFFLLQLLFAHFWLKNHRFGPLEWAWRRLSYGRLK